MIADDFDILAAGGAEPLRPLVPYLASARDLRFTVVVSRPVAGASRAMFDVALQGVRDTGGTALIMSGDRSEGQLLPKLYAEPMVAGRGRLARRGERPALVQIAQFQTTVTTDAAPTATVLPTESPLPDAHPVVAALPENGGGAEVLAGIAPTLPADVPAVVEPVGADVPASWSCRWGAGPSPEEETGCPVAACS